MGIVLRLYWLLFFLGSHGCPPPDNILPCQCARHGSELQIWCSHSEVSRVLAALQAVAKEVKQPIDELILENNALPSLPGRAFASLSVLRLMLRENGLQRLPANWLAGLEGSLVELFVVEPELRSLPDDSLEQMPRLEAVTIDAGAITRLPRLANLTQLRYLHTRLPKLVDLSMSRLQHMPALEQVHITSSPQLTRLEQLTFDNLPKLMLLDISETGIQWIHPRALTRLPSLVQLSLSRNKITDAGVVGRSIRELPSLAVLKLDDNLIEQLPETCFVDIPPLRELHLFKNSITEINRGAFHRLPGLRLLDLSDNRIRRIHPEFFLQPYDSGLEEFRIVNNQLDDILQLRIILEALPRLKFLDISGNRLQDITYGSLRGHGFLERLHMDHNQLRRVVRDAFVAMPALRELRLKNNSMSNYLEMPLWNLPALKGLDISYNEFHRLDRRMLANLPSLRRLDVSGNALVTVDAAAFLATPALEHVNLSHNALQEVSPTTFAHMAKLFELDLNSNRLREMVPGLPPALEFLHIARNHLSNMPSSPNSLSALKFIDISGNGIHKLSDDGFASMPLLKTIIAGDNGLQSVEERTFQGLSRLETLDLHNNRLMSVNERALRDLRRLRRLSLQSNRLDTLGAAMLRDNPALIQLDLSWNQLSRLPESLLAENRALQELLLSHNALSELPPDLGSLRQLRTLDMSHNRVAGLNPSLHGLATLAELRLAHNQLISLHEGDISEMPALALLDLHSNDIQYMAPHAIRGMPNLTAVRLGRNRLSVLPSAAFSGLPSLLSAELQENQLTDVASDAFTAVPNLLMLNLSHNQLTGLERAGLAGLHSLELLDMSFNRVWRFHADQLPSLHALVQLKLDNNRLCGIDGSPFHKMSRLRELSLRNNKMSSLPEASFKPLKQTMHSLDVEGNPLQCDCSLLWLQRWLQEAPYMTAEPRCGNGARLRDMRMSQQDCSGPRSAPPVAPGCDASVEYNSAGSSGTSGTPLSSLSDSRETTLRPLPEESEYFYEDFVEYEENSTLPFSSTSSSTSTEASSSSQTIPPGVMSHFIPGDTPTLYAGTRTSTPAPASNTPRQPNSPFTFFGMPLPSLSSFWGSGRDSDGRGRFTSSRGRGRVQQLPPPGPTLQQGFRPVFPGSSGGFRPSFNPFNESGSTEDSRSASQDSVYNHSDWDLPPPSNSLPHATVSKVVGPFRHTNLDLFTSSEEEFSFPSLFPVRHNNSLPLLESVGGRLPTSDEFTTRAPNTSSLDHMAFALPTTGLGNFSLPASTQADQPNQDEKIGSKEKPVGSTSSTTTTSSFLSDLWGAVSYNGKGPTSLSEFLAPGAVVVPTPLPTPSTSARPPGRPTITKVTLTPPLGPGPAPQAEDSQGVNPTAPPRLAKSPPHHYFSHQPPTAPQPNNSMAWYYNNYNKSELDSYVGPGLQTANLGGKSAAIVFTGSTPSIVLFITIVLVVY